MEIKSYPVLDINSEEFKKLSVQLLDKIVKNNFGDMLKKYGGKNLYNMAIYLQQRCCFKEKSINFKITLSNDFYVIINEDRGCFLSDIGIEYLNRYQQYLD